ncbi:uncharacterized protein N0V89_000380 [Didymosphaeria variabile]|uniref:C3H1-type domain-containing protein n=1 Tax=Didymosphaeria variabile TaxID=1932322 RepID=A0A9W9CFM8_9PLEO|nr:uncharacterized protein N0V89_000380 [Didymosphaeria variabile]KAJ4359824.1 hypothetical protein N0V89_000380 [Didymosphaeria variabile]
MSIHAQAVSSPSALPETVRYYIERNPGNILVPLIPVDQLLYQPQGVPTQLSIQQISEEKWQRVTGATEAAVVLPGLPRSPVTPTYRAPDYNVIVDAAVKVVEQDSGPEPCAASIRLTPSVEQHESKHQPRYIEKEKDKHVDSVPLSKSIHQPPIVQRKLAMATANLDVKQGSSTGPVKAQGATERQPPIRTHVNDYKIALRSAPLPDMGRDVVMRDAGNDIARDSHIETPRTLCSRIEKDQLTTNISNDNKTKLLDLRTTSTRSHCQPKIFCTHWISTGECSWGFRCRYKHEMPSLDVLKKETGFHAVPRWYKEKMAIQGRGPTWIERRMEAQKEGASHGDGMEAPSPRDFPDPSLLKRLQRESGSVAKQDVHPQRVVQERSPDLLLIDVDPPTIPVNPINSAQPASDVAQVLPPIATPSENKKRASTTLRRHSQISWSSNTTDSALPVKQPSKPKSPSKKAKLGPAPKPKRGLSASKYAPTEHKILVVKARRAPVGAQISRQNESSTSEDDITMAHRGHGTMELSLL